MNLKSLEKQLKYIKGLVAGFGLKHDDVDVKIGYPTSKITILPDKNKSNTEIEITLSEDEFDVVRNKTTYPDGVGWVQKNIVEIFYYLSCEEMKKKVKELLNE